MKEAVDFAHAHNAKAYIAANMVTHEGDEKGAGEFFRTVRDIGIDAAIISDMALMDICASEAPGLPIHLSTQSSAANYETLNFWKDEGLERVVLAREVSMDEIKEMQEKWMSKSKRLSTVQCVFLIQDVAYCQNHMVHRDANRGGCAQSCRWKYGLSDMPFAGEKNMVGAGEEEIEEKFSMSAVDLAMIQNLPDLIEAGWQIA